MKKIDINKIYDALKQKCPKKFQKKKKKRSWNAKTLSGITDLTHSEAIRFGFAMESLLQEMGEYCDKIKVVGLENILSEGVIDSFAKEKKQIDILLHHTEDNRYVYLEAKLNCEMDSEKFPHVISKIKRVAEAIEKQYKSRCVGKILTPWYRYEKGMPHQYSSDEIVYAQEYLKLLGFDYTEKEWYATIRKYSMKWLADIR